MTTVGSGVKFILPYLYPDNHMISNQGPDWDHAIHCAITYISIKIVMKIFGTIGVNSFSNEIKHMHICNTFEPLDPITLRKEEYYEVLDSHRFLKDKREKNVKGIILYSGNKQRVTIDKEYSAYPTAALESVFLTSANDAEEVRYVEFFDITKAFIQTSIEYEEDKVILCIRGNIPEILMIKAP